jgi:hypothetical protein
MSGPGCRPGSAPTFQKVALPGPRARRVTLRRLNRDEYNHTIAELFGIDFQPAEDFPADDTGYGFDDIGDVLSVSPVLTEKYFSRRRADRGPGGGQQGRASPPDPASETTSSWWPSRRRRSSWRGAVHARARRQARVES